MALFTAYAHLLSYPFCPFTAHNLQGVTWSSFGNGFQDFFNTVYWEIIETGFILKYCERNIFYVKARRYFWNVIFFNKIKSKLEKQFKQDSG